MSDRLKELSTQHCCWWKGFGPVRDREVVVFAVFSDTAKDGLRLTADSFENRHLINGALSFARRDYLARKQFDLKVVDPGQRRRGTLVGVVCANADRIRKIRVEIPTSGGAAQVRAFCILDYVESDDYDAHATAGYADATEAVKGGKLGVIRTKARLALAQEFGSIINANDVRWVTCWPILLGRLLWLARAVLAGAMEKLRQACRFSRR